MKSGCPSWTGKGNPITAVTNSHGYYEFTNLPPGTYTVLEVQPEGYVDGIDSAGSEGGIAINPADNLSPLVLSTLAVDPNDDAIIRINLYVADTAVNYNFSEVRFVRQPFIPPYDPDPTPPTIKELSPPPLPEPQAYPVPYAQPYETTPIDYGGGGLPMASTWHLSIINAGQPRGAESGVSEIIAISNPHFNPGSWLGTRMDRAVWKMLDNEGLAEEQCRFGFPGAIPLTGDFNGDGHDEVAILYRRPMVHRPSTATGRWDERRPLGQAGFRRRLACDRRLGRRWQDRYRYFWRRMGRRSSRHCHRAGLARQPERFLRAAIKIFRQTRKTLLAAFGL